MHIFSQFFNSKLEEHKKARNKNFKKNHFEMPLILYKLYILHIVFLISMMFKSSEGKVYLLRNIPQNLSKILHLEIGLNKLKIT